MTGPERLDAHRHRSGGRGLLRPQLPPQLPPQLRRMPCWVREAGERCPKTGRRVERATEYGGEPLDLAVAQRQDLSDGARLAGTHALERGMDERLDVLTVSSLNFPSPLGLLDDPGSQTGHLTQELGLLAAVEAELLAEHLQFRIENVICESLKPGHLDE